MRDEAEAQATKTRSPNYNAPNCGRDYSEEDARTERRLGDNSKPAPSDPYKKAM